MVEYVRVRLIKVNFKVIFRIRLALPSHSSTSARDMLRERARLKVKAMTIPRSLVA